MWVAHTRNGGWSCPMLESRFRQLQAHRSTTELFRYPHLKKHFLSQCHSWSLISTILTLRHFLVVAPTSVAQAKRNNIVQRVSPQRQAVTQPVRLIDHFLILFNHFEVCPLKCIEKMTRYKFPPLGICFGWPIHRTINFYSVMRIFLPSRPLEIK